MPLTTVEGTPPRGRPSATSTASNAGPQGRMLWNRCRVPTPASTALGTHGGRAVGGGRAPDTRRPSQQWQATPPRGRPPTGPAARSPHRACRPSQVGRNRDRTPPPPEHNRRSKGPGQDTRRGTNHVERPYRRPVPGPREVRTPHHPGRGGERTPRERERTHTQRARGDYQKGNQTDLAERTDRVEWRTSERG